MEYCWGCLGVILGPFGTNLSPFRSQTASNCGQFGADFTPCSDTKWPKYPQIMYSDTDPKYAVPGGSLWGHFWGDLVHLEPILGPFPGPVVLFELFFDQCHPSLLPKRALMPFYQMQWARL